MSPVVGTSVNDDDVRIAHAATGSKAFRERVMPPCIFCITILGRVVFLRRIGYCRAGESYVDLHLSRLHIIIDKTVPVCLIDQCESAVRSRIMSGISSRNPAFEGRDGVAYDTHSLLCHRLDIRICRKSRNRRIAISTSRPDRSGASVLKRSQKGSVSHLRHIILTASCLIAVVLASHWE